MNAIGPKECPNDKRRSSTPMSTIIGYDGPEVTALCGLSAWVQHRRAGFIDKDAVRAAQMGAHVVDDRHQVEACATHPVAQCPTVKVDPLPLEDLGLAVKRKVVAELRDDGEPSWRHRFEPDGEQR